MSGSSAGAAEGWQPGDRVVHLAKPEWGTGRVEEAAWTTHEGLRCQRLTIRFDRAGRKTLSTAFATLADAPDAALFAARAGNDDDDDAAPDAPTPAAGTQRRATRRADAPAPATPAAPRLVAPTRRPPQPEPDPFRLDPTKAKDVMTRLPEATRDPFANIEKRLRATLDLYRYTPDGKDLLDWAAVQSGVSDPLSAFTRQELEQLFYKFRINLDQHLGVLLEEARRSALPIDPLFEAAPPLARAALKRVNFRR